MPAPLASAARPDDNAAVPPDPDDSSTPPPADAATPSGPGDSTFFKFVLLVNLVARPFARLHERLHELPLAEWRVLRTLATAHGPITAGALGELLGMDKMAISRAIRGLEARGRLHRHPDPEDGRRMALGITEAGRALVARIEPSGREREAALLGVLDEVERVALDGLLDRLVMRARSLPDQPVAPIAAVKTRKGRAAPTRRASPPAHPPKR